MRVTSERGRLGRIFATIWEGVETETDVDGRVAECLFDKGIAAIGATPDNLNDCEGVLLTF